MSKTPKDTSKNLVLRGGFENWVFFTGKMVMQRWAWSVFRPFFLFIATIFMLPLSHFRPELPNGS